MPDRPHVCVFCGSSPGASGDYADAARRVGVSLAGLGLGLVYGGGRVGLMGVVADAALEAGGRVVGVIPGPLATKEIAHSGLTELHVVPGMHERKALMAARSAAFLTLPGGAGTYEEFFEVLTWAMLGLHAKPIGVLNVGGYFDPLLALLDRAVSDGFMRPAHRDLIAVFDRPESAAAGLLSRAPPPVGPKWIAPDQS